MAKSNFDFDPKNLPEEALAAIGLVLTCSAQTEEIVEMAIAALAGVDMEVGAALTTHMAMPLRFSILRSVAELKIDDLDALDELDDLVAAIDKAFEKRNAVAHHRWARDPQTSALFILKEAARRSYSLDLVPMTVDQIKSDAMVIYDLGIRLWAFFSSRNLLPAQPPIRPRSHKSKAERKKRRDALLRGEGAKRPK